jgi:hypothetical protein
MLMAHQRLFNFFRVFLLLLMEFVYNLGTISALEHQSNHAEVCSKKTKGSEEQFALF